MKRPTFAETVDILVKAYLNDTLEHGNCYACAVGNIVAARNGYTYVNCADANKRFALKENSGRYYGNTVGGNWFDHDEDLFLKEIDSTGYSYDEVRRIERAFEGANHSGDRMFNGLMAVVDVLADIHGIDLKAKEEAKLLFVKETSRD